jgi:hypothetical protein
MVFDYHKTVITGDADRVQHLWHGFEQRNVPLNVLMRGAHPYDGLKPKANGPQVDPRRIATNNTRILELLDSLAHCLFCRPARCRTGSQRARVSQRRHWLCNGASGLAQISGNGDQQ